MSQHDQLDKVITSVPVDSTAARVTSRGFQYQSPKKITQAHWEIAPPTIQVRPGTRDLTGHRCGRFVVVGKFREKRKPTETAMWLVRCDCSHYETRRAKALLNPNNQGDCCDRCRQLLYAKRAQHWRSTGHDIPLFGVEGDRSQGGSRDEF